uniref:BPTI/Kunitz inhibitor domain-containing protein n=1 Tax=Trichobilharzia regenti TaxID=157069 RepID=A0AA85JB99_TRIRE
MLGTILLILIFQKCSLSYNKICFYREDEGSGNHPLEKYYYNATIGECMTFIYLGYGGNDNNFYAKDVCEQTCKSSGKFDRRNCHEPCLRKECYDNHNHYYYDTQLRKCVPFGWT